MEGKANVMVGTAPDSTSTRPLEEREVDVIARLLHQPPQVEAFLRGWRVQRPLLWVATTERLLFLDDGPRASERWSLPYAQVSEVEMTAGASGATVRIQASGIWHVLDRADQEAGRVFAAHVFARCMESNPSAEKNAMRRGQRNVGNDRPPRAHPPSKPAA